MVKTVQKFNGALKFESDHDKGLAAYIAASYGQVTSRKYNENENVLYINDKQFRELEKVRKKGIIHYEEYHPINAKTCGVSLRQ
jgi:hypothetical protein